MKIEILGASAPVWANEGKTAITLKVRFGHYPQPLPFTATRDDTEEHGRELWSRSIHGEFGEIGPYVGMTADEELAVTFPVRQRKALAATEAKIAPLERAKRLGMATPEELEQLEALERHSVEVMRCEGPELPASPLV